MAHSCRPSAGEHLAQRRPCGREAGVELESRDVLDVDPVHGFAFSRARRDVDSRRECREERRIAPSTAVRTRLDVSVYHVHLRDVEATNLLHYFAKRGVQWLFGRVDSATGNSERPAVVHPVGALIEQDICAVHFTDCDEQTGSTIAPPMPTPTGNTCKPVQRRRRSRRMRRMRRSFRHNMRQACHRICFPDNDG
jgi:hypothetical protein